MSTLELLKHENDIVYRHLYTRLILAEHSHLATVTRLIHDHTENKLIKLRNSIRFFIICVIYGKV